MSGANLIKDFGEVATVTRQVQNLQNVVIGFDAQFVNGNIIHMLINGYEINVLWQNNHSATLTALLNAIIACPDIDTASIANPSANQILMRSKYAATNLVITKFYVTGGASQPKASIVLKSGGYIEGKIQETTPETFNIIISMQPLNGHELMKLPEGDRSREIMKGYTATELKIADEANGVRGDVVNYNGRHYEVIKSERWMVTDLNHFRLILAEVNQYL